MNLGNCRSKHYYVIQRNYTQISHFGGDMTDGLNYLFDCYSDCETDIKSFNSLKSLSVEITLERLH